MKGILTSVVQAMGEQAIALGTMGENVTALKLRLAKQFPELAEELKAEVYALQVNLAKLREAIAGLPEEKAQRKRKAAA